MAKTNEKMFVLVIEGDGNLYVKVHRTLEGCIASAREDWNHEVIARYREKTTWKSIEKALREDNHYCHELSNTTYTILKDCPVCK